MPPDEITLEHTLNEFQLGSHLVNSIVLGLKSRETPRRVESGTEIHRATYFEAFKRNLEDAIRSFERLKSRDAANTDPHIIYHELKAILRALKHYKEEYREFDAERVRPIQEVALNYCARYESGYVSSRFGAFSDSKLRNLAPKSEDVRSLFDTKESLGHHLMTDLESVKDSAVHETLKRLFVWLSCNYGSADDNQNFDGECNYPLPIINKNGIYIINLPMLPTDVQLLPADRRYVLGTAGLMTANCSPVVVIHFGPSPVALKKSSHQETKEALESYIKDPVSAIAGYVEAQKKNLGKNYFVF